MGCSASKTITTVAKNPEDPFPSPPTSSCSPSVSQSSNSSATVRRSLSLPMPLVHHPPTKKGDSHHLVSLTSTTYGSLLLIDQKGTNLTHHDYLIEPQSPQILTKTSQNRVIQTQPEHSLSPDSVINTWELMDGLDEEDSDDAAKKPFSCRYTTFDGSARNPLDCFESLKSSETVFAKKNKPLWQHLSEEALLAKLDPNVALSYRRALSSRGFRSMGSSPLKSSPFSNNSCNLPGSEDRIVVYFTSLRGIRKTYEDCCSVRMILRAFRVAIDERDISMDSNYRKELQNALGGKKAVTLPQVFIRGMYVGNAEEIKKLNESGELAKLFKGFPIQDPGFVCENCGDARFVPCPNCHGSRKVYEEEEGKLRRCPDCNENGLIRCPGCCS